MNTPAERYTAQLESQLAEATLMIQRMAFDLGEAQMRISELEEQAAQLDLLEAVVNVDEEMIDGAHA